MSDIDYLSSSFNPAVLTVPQLRSILVEHNVAYPSSALKPQLIELFNAHVLAQSAKLRAAQARVRRTTKGISNALGDHVNEGNDELSRPSSSRHRPSTSRSSINPDRTQPESRSRSRHSSQARKATTEHSRSQSRDHSRRRLRRSGVNLASSSPVVKNEESEQSPFSQDNPFQCKVSPNSHTLTVLSNRKSEDFSARKKRHTTSHRYTIGCDADSPDVNIGIIRARGRSIGKRLSLNDPEPYSEEYISPSEDYDPTIRQSTCTERHSRIRKSKRQSSKRAYWALIIALGGGAFTLWRQEKLSVGYCGVGSPSIEFPDWLHFFQPKCELCPSHAYCYDNLVTHCEVGFVVQPSVFSFGGIIPIPPTCEADGEKARKVRAVADKAVDELRIKHAKFECGTVDASSTDKVNSAEYTLQELKNVVTAQRRRGMPSSEFDDLWQSSIHSITNREEVRVRTEKNQTYISSNSLARVSLGCAIKLWLRRQVAKHTLKIIIFSAMMTVGLIVHGMIKTARKMEERAKHLAKFVLDRLAYQASLHAIDSKIYAEPWLSMVQLRDDILRDEFSATQRRKLWTKVQGKVEQNTNVRLSVREARNGEVSKVWEWIGPLDTIDSPILTERSSTRHSMYRHSGSRKSFGYERNRESDERFATGDGRSEYE